VFLTAPNPEAVQFAYFQSSLVVEFIVERYGLGAMKGILQALRDGDDSLAAISRHAAPLEDLDREFVVFAQRKALAFASDVAMENPPAPILRPGAEAQLTEWVEKNPGNFWGTLALARQWAKEERWDRMVPLLVDHIKRFPAHAEGDSAYAYLAAAYRNLDKPAEEEQVLTSWTASNDETTDAFLRLMILTEKREDWAAVARNAERFLAVNPMVATPYEYLARAETQLKHPPAAIAACETLLELGAANPSDVHFQLAELFYGIGDPAARTHVLAALEDAPRHREALALLLRIHQAQSPASVAR
ncbi:MAG: hypothetical protein KAX37_01455, partial [Opitutaceae bacterium]|nr:hypothetical protein [Opitutaceae bacterium]